MIHAYSECYLQKARTCLGDLLDYSVHDSHYSLKDVWNIFINSSLAARFEVGDPSIVAGRSGIELAMELLNVNDAHYPRYDRSKEYWVGWAISYYQWYRNIRFKDIQVPIDDIISLYSPYHEMDILHFCDRLDSLQGYDNTTSNLKRLRNKAGLTQNELSSLTGIPVRTIQQYEQKQKDINGARSEYLILLARALQCDPAMILE